jgi:hypothetical protein
VPRSDRRHPDPARPEALDPSHRETVVAVADAPTLEEVLRSLRDRYRFLEDHFLLQAEAAFAECDTEMSVDGLVGLTAICREGADRIDRLIDVLPADVIDARVQMTAVAARNARTSGRTHDIDE